MKYKVGDWVIYNREWGKPAFMKGQSYKIIEFTPNNLIRVIDNNNVLNGYGGSNDMWTLDTRSRTALWKVLYE